MSRIGKKPVEVPGGVKVNVADRTVTVEGPLGKLELTHRPEVSVAVSEDGKVVTVDRAGDERAARAFHGLTRALLQNMMVGVTQGYEKKLELQGVGYVAAIQNNELQLRVGLANELVKPIPQGLDVTCPDQQHILAGIVEDEPLLWDRLSGRNRQFALTGRVFVPTQIDKRDCPGLVLGGGGVTIERPVLGEWLI